MLNGKFVCPAATRAVLFNIVPQLFDIVAACIFISAALEAWIAVIVFVTLGSYIPVTIFLTEWRVKHRRCAQPPSPAIRILRSPAKHDPFAALFTMLVECMAKCMLARTCTRFCHTCVNKSMELRYDGRLAHGCHGQQSDPVTVSELVVGNKLVNSMPPRMHGAGR